MEDNININAADAEQPVSEQRQIRRDKLAALVEEGRNPFEITKCEVTASAEEIKADFDKFENQTVSIAGRIMSRRIMGKASFCDIMDGSGHIQSYIRRDDVGEESYGDFKKWDIGDIVSLSGFVFRTKT
ncbi:MAG: OB-fold nucleic acid binding domain-containing protein, partial [Firmicutes bacterium]|nr:OB-fold nucleic acid binding domain-containing protein [Bacillota bacterium]